MAEGALGDITRYESRFERWHPEVDATKWRDSETPKQGGLLLNLSRLVHQAPDPLRSDHTHLRRDRGAARFPGR